MRQVFGRLGNFIEARPKTILLLGLALIVAAVFGAMNLGMASGIETFVSTDSPTYRDLQRFNDNFGSETVVVLTSGDSLSQLLSPENLKALEHVEAEAAASPDVVSAVGPAVLVKQMRQQRDGISELPEDPKLILDLVLDPETGRPRQEFKVILPDEQHTLTFITIKGGLTLDREQEAAQRIVDLVGSTPWKGVEPLVTGQAVMGVLINDLMLTSLRNMLILAVFLMLGILALLFRVHGLFPWRWLALGLVILATVYTFGAMGVLSIPITMASMVVFPILIGLGVDYGIQFHNRFDEETRRGQPAGQAIITAVSRVGPATGVALVATSFSFGAMLLSPIPMIQDFTKMLILGLAICYLTALFLVPALLYWRQRRFPAPAARPNPGPSLLGKGKAPSWLEAGLARLARLVISRPALIIPAALLLTAGGLFLDSRVGIETDEAKFISQDLEPIKALNTLVEIAGSSGSFSVLVEAQDVTEPAVLNWMLQTQEAMEARHPGQVARAQSVADLVAQANGGSLPPDSAGVRQILEDVSAPIRRNLVSQDYTAANLVVDIADIEIDEVQELVPALREDIDEAPPGVRASLTGAPMLWVEMFDALTGGRRQMNFLGMGLIFVVLTLIFRFNLVKAFIATLPIALVLGWSSGAMYLLGIRYNPMTATMGALILGIGTEFTILLMMRYYEEREKGTAPAQAMTEAMTRIGRAIVVSGATTFVGFGALLSATQFLILRDFGIVTMVDVFFALVSTLVVLPPLVVLVDRWQERRRLALPRKGWPGRRRGHEPAQGVG